MIKFDDLDKVLKMRSVSLLNYDYTIRQQEQNNINNAKAKTVMNIFFNEGSRAWPNASDADYLIVKMALIINSNPTQKEYFKYCLNKIGFQSAYELMSLMRMMDLISTKDLGLESINIMKNVFFTMKDVNFQQSNCSILLPNNNQGKLHYASDLTGINIFHGERRGHCHDVTGQFLVKRPSLMGAYYYIPLPFSGHFEHSVLIDADKNMVYDLSQNIAIPLELWHEYYQPSFMISGEEFIELQLKAMEKYHTSISMNTIEEVKRVLKK